MLEVLPRSPFKNEEFPPPALLAALPRKTLQLKQKIPALSKATLLPGQSNETTGQPRDVKGLGPLSRFGAAPELSFRWDCTAAQFSFSLCSVPLASPPSTGVGPKNTPYKPPAHNSLSQSLLPVEPALRHHCHKNLPNKPFRLSGLAQALILPALRSVGQRGWLCSRCCSSGLGFRL